MRGYLNEIQCCAKREFISIRWYFIFANCFFCIGLFSASLCGQLTNSDESSELILSNLLSQNNQFFSTDWFYSTELRVLHSQIISSLFFKFLDNWHWVRVIGMAILFIIFIASYYFFCYAFQCRKYFAWTAILLLLPFSYQWFSVVLIFPHYIPHISLLFISVALCELCAKNQDKKHLKQLLWIAAGVAFIAGIGGPRQLVVSYIPLFLAGALIYLLDCRVLSSTRKIVENLRANRYFELCALISLIAASLGFAINRHLHKYYYFMRWHKRHFQSLDFQRVQEVFNGFLECFGVVNADFSAQILLKNSLSFIFIVIFILGIFILIKRRQKENGASGRFGLFCLMAVSFFIILYFFTDMYYTQRYSLPVIVLFIPILAYGASLFKIAKYLLIVLAIFLSIHSFVFYLDTTQRKSALPIIAKTLTEKGYKNGYATFWKANVITELSNGNMDMYIFADDENNLKSFLNIYELSRWLKKIDHLENKPQGKVFVLFSKPQDQNNSCPKMKILGKEEYQSEFFIAYGFDSYQTLKNATIQ